MKLKLLVEGLYLLKTYNQFSKTLLSNKQFSNMPIEIYIIHTISISKFYLLLSLLIICIDHQSHRYSEIKTDHNWHHCKTSSATSDYCGPQQISYLSKSFL